jgi:hypothetical protein
MPAPRRDTLGLFERIAAELRADPTIGTTELQRRVRARRSDVLRALRTARLLQGGPEPGSALPSPPTRFPNAARRSGDPASNGDLEAGPISYLAR